MPGLLNFLSAVGAQYNYNRQVAGEQAELEGRQAMAALRRQEVEDAKAAAAEKKRLEGVSREVGDYLSQNRAAEDQTIADPLRSAKAFSEAATLAYSRGAPDLAAKLETQAKQKAQEAKEAAQARDLERKQAQEALSESAASFALNPTPEGANDLVRRAVAAGQNPLQIPAPNTPQFTSWAKAQQQAGMSAKERLATAEKQREFDATQERLKQEHADRVKQQEEDRKVRAMIASGNQELRKQGLWIQAQLLKLREAKAAAGAGAGSVSERDRVSKLNATTAQLAQQFELLGDFSPGENLPTFSDLKTGSDVSAALSKLGTTRVTPAMQQMLKATAAQAGSALARLAQTAEGGRGPTEAIMKKTEESIVPQAGESGLTAMFKHIRFAEEVRAFIDHTDKRFATPEQLEQLEETKKRFAVPISSRELLKRVRQSGNTKALEQMMESNATISGAFEEFARSAKEGKGKATPPGKPSATPPGKLTPEEQAAFDRY